MFDYTRHLCGAVLVEIHVCDEAKRERLGTRFSIDWYLRRTEATLDPKTRKRAFSSVETGALDNAMKIGDHLANFVPSDAFHGDVYLRNIGGTRPRLAGHVHLYITPEMKAVAAFARWEAFVKHAANTISGLSGTLSPKRGAEARFHRHPPQTGGL